MDPKECAEEAAASTRGNRDDATAATASVAESPVAKRGKTTTAPAAADFTVGDHRVEDEELEGAVFDCDGTLIDSMGAWLPSWQHACGKFGLEMSERRFWGFAGVPLPDIVAAIYSDKHGAEAVPSAAFVADFLAAKRAFHDGAEQDRGSPPAIECVLALVRDYKARGVKCAIASSGLRDVVERHCTHANILSLFDAVVVAAEVPRGKPAPDVFLKAAELLGAAPAKCRAYEDGESGIESAWRAGMQVIDVRDMEGYPMNEGLRSAMLAQRESRTWLQ